MWESISKLFGTNPTMVVVITIVGTFTVWLYKEFKVMSNEDYQSNVTLVNKKIEMYSKLEAAIAMVLHHKDRELAKSNLFEKFGEFSSYFSDDVRLIMRDYYKQGDSALLMTMLAFSEVEVNKLEKQKAALLKENNSTDVVDSISRLARPLQPIGMVWGLILFVILFLGQLSEKGTLLEKVQWGFVGISSIVALSFIYALISLLIENKLARFSVYRWIWVVGMTLVPWLSFSSMNLSLLFVAIQVSSTVMFVISGKKKHKGIILMDS